MDLVLCEMDWSYFLSHSWFDLVLGEKSGTDSETKQKMLHFQLIHGR